MDKTVGEIMRENRKARQMKQIDIAKLVDCEIYWVSLIESGKRIPTQGNKLRKMCEVYGLDYAEILGKAKEEKAGKE
jgi:transcriptional regulator with XRE-family HTH domain